MLKRGSQIIWPTLISILLSVMFVTTLAFGVMSASHGMIVYEKAYAKQIALLLDKSGAGMEIKLDVEDVLNLAKENDFKSDVFVLDLEKSLVKVQTRELGGYEVYFFTDLV